MFLSLNLGGKLASCIEDPSRVESAGQNMTISQSAMAITVFVVMDVVDWNPRYTLIRYLLKSTPRSYTLVGYGKSSSFNQALPH